MHGKRAMVTGASEGIGKAFAEALAARGYEVVLVARRAALLESVRAGLSGSGHRVVAADLATAEGLAAAQASLREAPLNLLVNNAGVGAVGPFSSSSCQVQAGLVAVNVSALLQLSLVFCAQAQVGDALINVSSILGFVPQPSQPVYAATKAFVTSLSESLWYEMRARGVLVVGVHPGATETRFGEHAGRTPGWSRPKAMLQTPEAVVAESLKALDARRGPTVVTGFHNRIFVAATRLLPRSLLVRLMARAE